MEKKKVMRRIPNCIDHGSYPIWLTGSRLTYWRNVWESEDAKYWIIWGNQPIEIKRDDWGHWNTVEKY